MLFTIFETEVVVNKIKVKEKILLNKCIVDYEETINSALNDTNKFKMRILVPTGNKNIN